MIVVSMDGTKTGKLNVTQIMIVVFVKFVTNGVISVTDQPMNIVLLVFLVISYNLLSVPELSVYQTVQLVT
jgi:hypothetical protein